MELKKFQKRVLLNLESYATFYNELSSGKQAYEAYLKESGLVPGKNGIKRYIDDLNDIPKVCIKVPTGGGKTFIGASTIEILVNALEEKSSNTIVWLVPRKEILRQTLRQLQNPANALRISLDRAFAHLIEVLDKEDGLFARGFNALSVDEQITIFVLSYDSFKYKDGLRAFQENPNLDALTKKQRIEGKDIRVEGADQTALITALANTNPIIIIDESHHAKSKLSLNMLRDLNPSFVLELTATPSNHSNIISRVSALELKQEEMVKLPVVVYRRNSKNEVVQDVVLLQRKLEQVAKQNEERTGSYIRPIALLQAESKGSDDAETFEKLRQKLVDADIPEEQIAIRTGSIDELKGIDLMSKSCPIRFVITIEALSEGWDCPFAYILASVANKSSKTSVEQIVGRVLRQPYAKRAKTRCLNISYVLTSSSDFNKTIDQVVVGLNNAGFSKKDIRSVVENSQNNDSNNTPSIAGAINKLNKQKTEDDPEELELDFKKPSIDGVKSNNTNIEDVIHRSEQIEEEYEQKEAQEPTGIFGPTGLGDASNMYLIKERFFEKLKSTKLPMFCIKEEQSLFSLNEDGFQILAPEALLENFDLTKASTENIHFPNTSASFMREVDISEDANIKIKTLSERNINELRKLFSKIPEERKREEVTSSIYNCIPSRTKDTYGQKGLKSYIRRAINNLSNDDLDSFIDNSSLFAETISRGINNLANEYKHREFLRLRSRNEIILKLRYMFPKSIQTTSPLTTYDKSLYYAEDGQLNSFERKMVETLAYSSNIVWWHRVQDRKPDEFYINGFINHYPDFLALTESSNILAIETKGEMIKNPEQERKLELGNIWASAAGDSFKYFMIFESSPFDEQGSYSFNSFINEILPYL